MEGSHFSTPVGPSGDRFHAVPSKVTPDKMEVVECTAEGKRKCESAQLTTFVVDHVWPFKKFIVLDAELEDQSVLMKRHCHKMNLTNMSAEKQWEMWSRVMERVRKKLNIKRNNVNEIVKKEMMSEWECGVVPSGV